MIPLMMIPMLLAGWWSKASTRPTALSPRSTSRCLARPARNAGPLCPLTGGPTCTGAAWPAGGGMRPEQESRHAIAAALGLFVGGMLALWAIQALSNPV